MAIRYPTNFPQRLNQRVPNMAYDAQIQQGGHVYVEFGTPAAASTTAIVVAQDMTSAGTLTSFAATYLPSNESMMGRYGRMLAVQASGASTGTVTVKGRDYLGQSMVENLTLNGVTAVAGVKAFRYVDAITWTATAATNLLVGVGTGLGVPYRIQHTIITNELLNGGQATAGALVVGSTAVATATTTDPRGKYTPNSAPNGTNTYTLMYFADQTNLHGNAHFST
jgi:hypothetical protein